MAEVEDGSGSKRPPKVVKFRPKGEPIVVPTPTSKFASAADEWVQSDDRKLTMRKLAKKWGISKTQLYVWRKKENWDERKRQFNRLVEEKKAALAAETPPTGQNRPRPDPKQQDPEVTRQARVDETAADKKAQAEIVLHEIAYAMTGALANAMDRDSVANLDKPKSLAELFRTGKDVAIFHKMVIGDPEPPPKPLQVFEVQFQTRGGAINTIERLGSETLEDAMARLRKEYTEAEERLISSFMEPAGGTG